MTAVLRRALLVLALGALVADLAGCARKRIVPPGVSQVEAKLGETIVLQFPASPTTGYSWTLRGRIDVNVVALVGIDYEAEANAVAGSGGLTRVTFEAVGRGTTTVTLDYRRPWEAAPPEKTETVTIVVK